MLKVVNFLKMMWLIVGAITFLVGTYHLLFTDVRDAMYFYFFSAFAFVLFYVRKRQLKRLQNMSK